MEEEVDPLDFGVTPSLFLEWRSPRFGSSNPTKVESKVWEWLVKSKLSGYGATEKMNGPSPFDKGPTWCFDRFGQSCTLLPDGRRLYIGGEHEDYYDPDFFIYNDVVVEHPNGHLEFFCYPRESFLPTDFHSATLVGSRVVIIGSLGYPEGRQVGHTQIYLLDTESYQIESIGPEGESPGWIHKHSARLNSDAKAITLTGGKVYLGDQHSLRENIDDWELDLQSWRWKRLTERNWPRWEVLRQDRTRNHLWEMRQALWHQSVNWIDNYKEDIETLEAELDYMPDVASVNELYSFPFEAGELVEDEDAHNLYWIYVDGIKVRFVEEDFAIEVTVEGALPDSTIELMQQTLLERLSALENAPCELEIY
ncbi:MAG: hypothetical protein KZQ95_18215 [Candidatus Thiodiazotropha sp. (ex Epidulcina cf. delphinae)]|nr:hypothetical protein [Candidatus Thiodiazotropha sp. (ex Epidulcina cf. delphinae)]